jgi:hypothetical protein
MSGAPPIFQIGLYILQYGIGIAFLVLLLQSDAEGHNIWPSILNIVMLFVGLCYVFGGLLLKPQLPNSGWIWLPWVFSSGALLALLVAR